MHCTRWDFIVLLRSVQYFGMYIVVYGRKHLPNKLFPFKSRLDIMKIRVGYGYLLDTHKWLGGRCLCFLRVTTTGRRKNTLDEHDAYLAYRARTAHLPYIFIIAPFGWLNDDEEAAETCLHVALFGHTLGACVFRSIYIFE